MFRMFKNAKCLALTLVVMVLASCSKDEYLNVIPKESSMVMSVDLASIAKKGDMANSDLLKVLNDATASLSKNDKEKAKKYTDDPREMGIDLLEPIYVFKTPTQYIGVAMKIDDEDKFSEFLDVLRDNGSCTKIVEHEGKKFGALMDCDFAYNDNTFALLIPLAANSKAGNRSVLTSMFNQKENESFASTDNFKKMADGNGDILMYINMGVLPANTPLAQVYGMNGMKPSDVEGFLSTSFVDGKMVMTTEVSGKTEAAKKMLEESTKSMRKIEGKYINVPTDKSLMWFCAGVKGVEYLKNLKKTPQVKELLLLAERTVDIEKILNSVEGDFSVTVGELPSASGNFMSLNSFMPDYLITANLNNTDFLKDADYWKRSMRDYGFTMTETDKNQYSISNGDIDINWGVDGNDLYFASKNALLKNAFTQHSNILDAYKDDIKDSYMYMFFNLDALFSSQVMGMIGQVPAVKKRVSCLKSFIIQSKETNKCDVILELKDNKTNFLKQMF